MLHDLIYRLRCLLRRRTAESDLDAELRFHVEQQTAKLTAAGLSPAEAAREASLLLGGREQVKEECRDARGLQWWDEARQNLRYACRTLVGCPGFTTVAVLTMTLGIGVNTALFTIINAVLFRPIPIAHPENYYALQYGTTMADLRMLQERAGTVHQLAASWFIMPTLGDTGEILQGHRVSVNYFETLGIRASIGRVFSSSDADTGDSAVLSDHFWTRHFHRDPSAIGQTLTLDGRRYTIIGITEPGFIGTMPMVSNFWTLLPSGPAAGPVAAIISGRLSAGVSKAQAEAELTALFAREHPVAGGRPNPVTLQSRATFIPSDARGVVSITALLAACAGVVLLIGCSNLANLMLARAATRQREIAIRLSLGASRARVVRQLLTESALIASLGGAASLLLSAWILPVAARAIQTHLPRIAGTWSLDLVPDLQVFAWTIATCGLAGLLFGLAPAFTATRVGFSEALKDGGSQGIHWSRSRLRSSLVVMQVALCLILLINAGLFARSLRNAHTADPGFNIDHTIVVQYDGPATTQSSMPPSQLLRQLSAHPEVTASAAAFRAPLIGYGMDPTHRMPLNQITEGYFATLGIPVVRGRGFTVPEVSANAPVIVISEGAARLLFPGQDPVGEVLTTDRPRIVVGVARDTRSVSLRQVDPAYLYTPLPPEQLDRGARLLLRTIPEAAVLESGIRREVARVTNAPILVYTLGFALYMQRLPAQPVRLSLPCLGRWRYCSPR